ncbi:MAG: prephenate dehydrogenase [Gammaproteobacteria bacterium]|jgi:prephenate dehydrogenase|nr:prephenate dehydrogenase [Gammaproteobacteria bacterium]MBT6755291.1 prephenate dehydrogenase [Gammaproteobacteria bacterium]MBT7523638.1 prephenate dehydrogenase [Gammaproteobacteria bacterium]MBT7814166.1 prephenate dehydrogenase [Gammaproteobacteria bacterium]
MSNNKNIQINKIFVVGLGLIGASLCRSLKNNQKYEKIIGYDCDKDVTDFAIKNNYVDEISQGIKAGINNSDLIVICVPVHQIKDILHILKDFFNTEKIFTDTLSTKNTLLEFMIKNNFSETKNFILSHPMAGTENYGIENSKDDLFAGAVTLISTLVDQNLDNINSVKDMWQSLDCNVVSIDSAIHDEYLSIISHAPHAISFALAKNTNAKYLTKKLPEINSKGSLSDMIRIANSDPEAWANIFKDNQSNLIKYLDEYLEELSELKSMIASENIDDLVSYLKKSKPIK